MLQILDPLPYMEDFAEAIKEGERQLWVHTTGGSALDLFAMQCIAEKGDVEIHVAGTCPGVLIAAKRVTIHPSALIFLHGCWTSHGGNSEEILSTSDLLEKLDRSVASVIARTREIPVATISRWMIGYRWFNAEEAFTAGLVDEITDRIGPVAQRVERPAHNRSVESSSLSGSTMTK